MACKPIPAKLGVFVLLLINLASPASIPSVTESNSLFSNSLFSELIKNSNKNENVVYSPTSVQTCMALVLFGANGQTAQEISEGLHLHNLDKPGVAKRFNNLLSNSKANTQFQIANKIFVNNQYQVKNSFNEVAKESFQSEAESIDFKDSDTVNKINSWVETKTNNNIKNLVSKVDKDDIMILVNAIHLKAKWELTFDKFKTRENDFWTTPEKSEKIAMMTQKDSSYPYANWDELDATALEMKYENSDLSMVIVLPNKRDGLTGLENKLPKVNLLELSKGLKEIDTINLYLPKFTIESEFDLNEPLKQLGMKKMFSDSAEFSDLVEESKPIKISEVVHKAFIKVDELGTEASAATYARPIPQAAFISKEFKVDHPFFYFIKDQENIYFMGHVTKPDKSAVMDYSNVEYRFE